MTGPRKAFPEILRLFRDGKPTDRGYVVLSAILLALCFFPSPLWDAVRPALAWVALAPLYLVLRNLPGDLRPRLRSAAGSGYLFGLLLHLVGAYWLTNLVPEWPLAVLPYASVAVIEALWFALFALGFSVAGPRGPAAPWLFAALWTVFEWLRTLGAYAFPWFPLAATQVPWTPMLAICSVTGQWGLSFALALTGAWVGERIAEGKRDARGWPVIGTVPAALAIGGAVALSNTPGAIGTATVAVAQASYGGIYPEESLKAYLELAREAVAANGRPLDLVVMPESTFWDELLRRSDAWPAVSGTAATLQTSILLGTEETEGKRRFNVGMLVGRQGDYVASARKIKIVPLGEFFPFREVLGPIYAQFPTGNNDLTPGDRPGVLRLPDSDVVAGTLICYESAFGWRARQEALAGAVLLTVITNDAWFGNSAGPLQHADLASLRAAETGRAVARAATSGESRLIDPAGRVLATIPLLERGTQTATLPLRNDRTLYVRFGDWFLAVCISLLIYAAYRNRQSH
ncbi:MAG: apolipoprotein N-acyltransferase [Capsulimonadales bacterium]|nr:apolipoprotein N-acyltransferase [Capsulimonadales bacterium]